MSERWKYQLKTGLFWGCFMALAMTGIEAMEQHSFHPYLTLNFILKLVVYSIPGIFFLGYFNWKARQKTTK